MMRSVMRIAPVFGIILALLSMPAVAAGYSEAKTPTQKQLLDLLSGNSIEGVWAGRPFDQFFAASGRTRYREAGGSETSGRWSVNPKGQYCSVWPPSSSEVCYDVRVEGKTLYWKSGEKVYLSIVSEGASF